ncbi:hypothetical protein HYFRA_00010368 [Hymenoscyphus fraxineus]|uniref:NADP-dependent oxidoreductase domain-containing protein n=1 Tax=Hymenoscyphus fraxineus TaxID=746836 RepID=A0A9N9KYQ3_9HELO|nr:hypothetical protein HYFRA_00010368 [Hymenoscyphus fraxineus]
MMVLSPQTSFALEGTDIRIPSCGVGKFQPDPSLYPDTSVKDSVLQALKIGYRHIDAALAYGWGAVEKDIGDAIRESGIPREELYFHNCFHAPEDVSVGMEMSLENLAQDYEKRPKEHKGALSQCTWHTGTRLEPTCIQPNLGGHGEIGAQREDTIDRRIQLFQSKLARLLKTAKIHPVANRVEATMILPGMAAFQCFADYVVSP